MKSLTLPKITFVLAQGLGLYCDCLAQRSDRLTLLSDNLLSRFRAISCQTEASPTRLASHPPQNLVNGLWRQEKLSQIKYSICLSRFQYLSRIHEQHDDKDISSSLLAVRWGAVDKASIGLGIAFSFPFRSLPQRHITQRHEIFIFPSFHLAPRRHETEVCWWTSVLMMINKLHLSELLSANGAENMPGERAEETRCKLEI